MAQHATRTGPAPAEAAGPPAGARPAAPSGLRHSPVARLLVGIAISVVFLAITLARVDLPKVGAVMGQAAPGLLLLALAIVLVDLCLRALRWKVLLDPLQAPEHRPPYRLAFGYLTIGFLANAVLPARLGDVARAYLAGRDFGISKLAVFGTIIIERISDGMVMLVLAAVSVVAVGAVAGTGNLVVFGAIALVVGAITLVIAWLVLTRTRFAASRIGALIAGFAARIGDGASAMRQPRSAAAFVGLTAVTATTAILVAACITRAVGLELTPMEVVLFLSGIALSLAIPAAPGAIGTYEFFGVAIIESLGYSPELGLATVLLMRIFTTLPPVILGVVSVVALQIRPGELLAETTAAET
jgi:uncharacterized protein (TIRG00374 family)